MIPLPTVWIAAAALAIGASGGYWLAAKVCAGQTAQAREALARCEAGRSDDARAAAEKTANLLAQAQEAEAQAAARLAAQRAAADKKLQEIRRDIYRLSSGRECLSSALRLRLNAAIAADDMPTGSGSADPAAAESPAYPSDTQAVGTDADIAGWILDAARLYDECRARIDAIRQWDEVTNGR